MSHSYAGESRSFITKYYDHKFRRGTSGNKEGLHQNCKYTSVVFLEEVFLGCKDEFPNSGNAITKVIDLGRTNCS